MNFTYTAKSLAGETATGVLEAASQAAARQELRVRGLFALSLAPTSGAAGQQAQPARRAWRTRVPTRDMLMLTSQLVIMCRSGVNLADAFQNAARQCTQPRLKAALEQVYADVSAGQKVSAALGRQSDVFGHAYVASVAAGEASGRVTEVLTRMGDLLRNEAKLRNTVRGVLSYPIVLMAVSSIVLAALLFFVLPQFSQVFKTLDIPPPASTQLLMDIATELKVRYWLWGGLLALGVVAVARLWITENGKKYRDHWALNLMVIRTVTRSLLTGRAFCLMGTMLQNGVPLLDAIQLSRSAITNKVYQELFNTLEREVLSGNGIGRTLASSPFVPSGAAEMVLTGEKSGNLGSVMQIVGQYYEDEGEQQLREMAKLLEPAIIVSMGVIVAFVVSSVMLPMFEFSQAK